MGVYYYGSDLNVRYFDTTQAFFGGTGLLSKDGLPKPSYYALEFMRQLDGDIVGYGDGYIVTADGRHSYHVLLFNSKNFNYNYFTKNEDQMMPNDLQSIFTDNDAVEIELELENIKPGEYHIKTYRVAPDTGSALNEWRRIGENFELDMSDQDYLKRICIPRVTIRRQSAGEGSLMIRETLQAHEMRYVHIYK